MIQYNTTRNLLTSKLTPFYLNLSRDRVTEEDSTVKILNPLHRALNFPHKITSEDFENWVQERGLYFPNKWDKNFIPMLSMNDKNEEEKLGSLLIGNHGEGKIIYTGLSFLGRYHRGYRSLSFTNQFNFTRTMKIFDKKEYLFIVVINVCYWIVFL